jgi:hypothetical protein
MRRKVSSPSDVSFLVATALRHNRLALSGLRTLNTMIKMFTNFFRLDLARNGNLVDHALPRRGGAKGLGGCGNRKASNHQAYRTRSWESSRLRIDARGWHTSASAGVAYQSCAAYNDPNSRGERRKSSALFGRRGTGDGRQSHSGKSRVKD